MAFTLRRFLGQAIGKSPAEWAHPDGGGRFADIAKNGSGESVALLRRHHIGPAEIDRILAKSGVGVVAA